jgi:hypothetical protein
MDRQEFQYLCDFYKIKEVPLFYNGSFCGCVTRDCKYNRHNALREYRKDGYAIEAAYESIHKVIDLLQEIDKETEVTVLDVQQRDTWEYDDGRGYVTHHVYPKTVKTSKTVIFSGTLDSIFERFDKANNKLRYCNGHWFEFEDKKVDEKYRMWLKMIPYERSFNMYYGEGIVD